MLELHAAIDQMAEWDTQALLSLNGHFSPFMDQLMMLISDKYIWLPLYLALALAIYLKAHWSRAAVFLVMLTLMIVATDQTCGSLLRPMVERMRPSNLDNPIAPLVHIVDDYRGGRYGFPSCHAANTFALALYLSGIFRRRWFTVAVFAWAVVVAFSRIYLGVHYPGDILVGAVIGSLYAILFLRLAYATIFTIRMHRYSLRSFALMVWSRKEVGV